MIIDMILERKDNNHVVTDRGCVPYNAEDFYRELFEYGEVGFGITRALDEGTEEDIKQALCKYIDDNNYSKDIKDYINSVTWLM